MGKRRGAFLWISTMALTGMIAAVPVKSTGGEESSSACIACHTDLDEMDSYGAASAKEGAGIAG